MRREGETFNVQRSTSNVELKSADFHAKPAARVRSIQHALNRAELDRKQLPQIVQVSPWDWDRVILADEVYRLQKALMKALQDAA